MAKKDFSKGMNEILLTNTNKDDKRQEQTPEYVHSSFVIEKTLHKKIRKYALDNDMKIQDVIREALKVFLNK